MYDNWERDADAKAADAKDGWDAMVAQLSEDESWAQYIFDRTYNHWDNQ